MHLARHAGGGLFLLNGLAATALAQRPVARDSSLLPSYDYVVVGGGVSGLTVANRLSEDDGQ